MFQLSQYPVETDITKFSRKNSMVLKKINSIRNIRIKGAINNLIV